MISSSLALEKKEFFDQRETEEEEEEVPMHPEPVPEVVLG